LTPLHVLSLGKSLWDLYEEISEHNEDSSSNESGNDRNANDIDLAPTYRWFTNEEFTCPCCNHNRISGDLVNRLDYARDKAGIPFRVSSGFRCKQRNKRIGGKPRSSHLEGYACDIICPSGAIKSTVVASLFASGIKRIGIYKSFIHADISPTLPSPMLWIG